MVRVIISSGILLNTRLRCGVSKGRLIADINMVSVIVPNRDPVHTAAAEISMARVEDSFGTGCRAHLITSRYNYMVRVIQTQTATHLEPRYRLFVCLFTNKQTISRLQVLQEPRYRL